MFRGILIFATGALTGVYIQQNYPLPNFKSELNSLANKKPAEPATRK